MCEGYQIRRSKEFEHTRAIVYAIASVNRDPKKSFPKIQDFWPLMTDAKADENDQREGDRLQDMLKKYKESHKNKR